MKEGATGEIFEASVGADRSIIVPREILHRLGLEAGSRVSVRLLPALLAAELERRNIGPGEVERISAVQLESREQVIAFLLAEGALRVRRPATRLRKARTKK